MIVPIAPKVKKQPKAKASPATKPAAQVVFASHDKTPIVFASRDRIRERAFHIYENRGGEPGHDVQDWLRAEHQVLQG
jgi:hypothetical protein